MKDYDYYTVNIESGLMSANNPLYISHEVSDEDVRERIIRHDLAGNKAVIRALLAILKLRVTWKEFYGYDTGKGWFRLKPSFYTLKKVKEGKIKIWGGREGVPGTELKY
jgi:hypothetical protein